MANTRSTVHLWQANSNWAGVGLVGKHDRGQIQTQSGGLSAVRTRSHMFSHYPVIHSSSGTGHSLVTGRYYTGGGGSEDGWVGLSGFPPILGKVQPPRANFKQNPVFQFSNRDRLEQPHPFRRSKIVDMLGALIDIFTPEPAAPESSEISPAKPGFSQQFSNISARLRNSVRTPASVQDRSHSQESTDVLVTHTRFSSASLQASSSLNQRAQTSHM